MKSLLLTIALLLPTVALAMTYDDLDGKPRNSWERQQETYRQHNYDTYKNGPLDETLAEERRKQERQREERERQERQQSQDRHGYGQYRSPY